jgi:tetratricopeptide (TPR) repeat protein
MRSQSTLSGFIEALGRAKEKSPEWRAVLAGMATLRACEAVLDVDIAPTEMYDRACMELTTIADLPVRRLLTGLLVVANPRLAISHEERRFKMATRLTAYGELLHSCAQWSQAIDVFEAVEYFAMHDVESLVYGTYRLSFAYRMARRLDEAERSYKRLIEIAERHQNTNMILEVELGLAKVVMTHGDMPRAEGLVTTVLDRAVELGARSVCGKAHTDLAFIAGVRLNPTGVLTHSHKAIAYLSDRDEIHRALVNIAVAMREREQPDVSRMVSDWLLEHAEESDIRAHALLNRYHLAVDAHDWLRTPFLRRDLGDIASRSAQFAAELYEVIAIEFATLGDWDRALHAAERMLSIAETERLEESIIGADEAIKEIRRKHIPVRFNFRPSPPRLPEEKNAVAAVALAITAFCHA